MSKILVIGACGQLGSELTLALRDTYGVESVVATDIKEPAGELANGPFDHLNARNKSDIEATIHRHQIKEIYHLAAILSANAEKNPIGSWDLNMESLLHVLQIGADKLVDKIYWPSSIAVFGPGTPKDMTPQHTIMDPNTVYGISKLAGERWCEYYHVKHGVDVRSLRYPGIISYKNEAGGGTTDYAVDIYMHAAKGKNYQCYLDQNTKLPMMYIDDAVSATIKLMASGPDKIKVRSSYNLAAFSVTPAHLAQSIQKTIPDFQVNYQPDFRQKIADSWPDAIDDSHARIDWGWSHDYETDTMTTTILEGLGISSHTV